MACRTALLAATVIAAFSSTAFAQRYPRVYSPTGRPYGPTVAGYQYQRQHGRPWHGYGGYNLGSGLEFGVGGYGISAGYGWHNGYYPRPYGYPYYGYRRPYVGNFYLPPVYTGPYRQWDLPSPMMPGAYDEERLEEPPIVDQPAPLPAPERTQPQRVPVPSTPETIARSVHKQDLGDTWMQKLDYANAISNYRAAAMIAPDRAEPKFRLGLALLATARFQDAIDQFQLGLDLDPNWPSKSFTFDEMLGAENMIEKSVVMNRVAEWVQQDVRDPNRLFLMGVTLHLERRPEAALFFDTAYKLTGGGNHLLAFLNAAPAQNGAVVPQNNAPANPPTRDNAPPVPPLPAPELGAGQSTPPGRTVTPAPQKPVPTVIPQKSTKSPETKSPPVNESNGVPPKPDSLLEKEKKETPPASPTPAPPKAAPPKRAPATAPQPAPAAPEKKDPAAADTNSTDSGPQLVPQG